MDTDDNIRRTVVLSGSLFARSNSLLGKPIRLLGKLVLFEQNIAQKLNVSAGEKIVASVHVDNPLVRERAGRLEKLAKLALFTRRGLRLGLERGAPEPNLDTGCFRRLVGRVEGQPLHHGRSRRLAFLLRPAALLALEHSLERLDKVCAGAEEHAADEIGGRDAGGALDDLEAARLLDEPVAVVAVAVGGDVVAVDHVLAAKVGDVGELGDVGRVADGAGDPAAGVGGSETLRQVHDGRALVGHDVLVGVDAAVELVAELTGLHHGAGMAWRCRDTVSMETDSPQVESMGVFPAETYRGGKSQSSHRPRSGRQGALAQARLEAVWYLAHSSWGVGCGVEGFAVCLDGQLGGGTVASVELWNGNKRCGVNPNQV